MREEYIRRVVLRPYKEGPTFRLTLIDDSKADPSRPGRWLIKYRLEQCERGKRTIVLFAGEDFGSSPLHATDSDESVRALLGFLTLRPGDTDPEYFENYSEAQREFAATHAETLSCYVLDRFGEG